jgi:hypothetical protein
VSKKSRRHAQPRRGQRGLRGVPGAPGIAPHELHTVIDRLEKIQADAATQFRRIAEMQVQIDQTLKALKEMGERAGRQRKKT